ncbi:MAG TPA: hypothetical protein VFV66_22160 [Nonomuraea sp.]|nr:hypothetical protein [Nonomuraea sp.]
MRGTGDFGRRIRYLCTAYGGPMDQDLRTGREGVVPHQITGRRIHGL